MRTNIIIDDQLLEEARRLSGLKTKRSTVEAGLRLLIQVHQQSPMRKLRGRVDWKGKLEESRLGRIAEDSSVYPKKGEDTEASD